MCAMYHVSGGVCRVLCCVVCVVCVVMRVMCVVCGWSCVVCGMVCGLGHGSYVVCRVTCVA